MIIPYQINSEHYKFNLIPSDFHEIGVVQQSTDIPILDECNSFWFTALNKYKTTTLTFHIFQHSLQFLFQLCETTPRSYIYCMHQKTLHG
jgi:hypothetical protein